MKTMVTYVAEDGTKFDDEHDCMDYEEKISIQKIYDSGIRFYDYDFKQIKKENIMDTKNIAYIYIPSDEIYYSLFPILELYLYDISIAYTDNGYYYYNSVTHDYESLEENIKHLLSIKESLERA